jgi:hypothetical protein
MFEVLGNFAKDYWLPSGSHAVAYVTVPAIRWVIGYWNPPGGHAVAYVTVPAIRWITNSYPPQVPGEVCRCAG